MAGGAAVGGVAAEVGAYRQGVVTPAAAVTTRTPITEATTSIWHTNMDSSITVTEPTATSWRNKNETRTTRCNTRPSEDWAVRGVREGGPAYAAHLRHQRGYK